MARNSDYAKICIACKELGLDRKQLISDRYRVESMREMSAFQLADLLGWLTKQGFKVRRQGPTPASPRYPRADQRKVVALWIGLAQAGVVKNRSHAALGAFVKKCTGLADLRFARPEHTGKLIEILKKLVWPGGCRCQLLIQSSVSRMSICRRSKSCRVSCA